MADQKNKVLLRIRALREENGWSQSELVAEIARNKGSVTTQSVSNWERGLSIPGGKHLEQLAKAFDVTVSELFG